ncbi:MAG: hypothetical protein AVDCRST_MAG06-1306, partial [uncultured Nocardioides sp.]
VHRRCHAHCHRPPAPPPGLGRPERRVQHRVQPPGRHLRHALRADLADPLRVGVHHLAARQRRHRRQPDGVLVRRLQLRGVHLRLGVQPPRLVVRQQLHHLDAGSDLHRPHLLDGGLRPGPPGLPGEGGGLRRDPRRADAADRGADPPAVHGVPCAGPARHLLGDRPPRRRPPRGRVRLPLLHQGHPGRPGRGRAHRRCVVVADLQPDRHAPVPAGDLRGGHLDVHHLVERLLVAAAGPHPDQVADDPRGSEQPGRRRRHPVRRDHGVRGPRDPAAAGGLPPAAAPDRPGSGQHRHQV